MSRALIPAYLRRQSLAVSMMALAVLVAVSTLLFLAELLGDVADGELLATTLPEMLLLRLPEALLLAGPLALLIGLLMAFGELAQGEEFTILRSSGFRPLDLLSVILQLAAIWAGLMLFVSGWAAPWSEQRQADLIERAADDLLVASIRPGQFQTLGGGRLTLYVQRADFDAGRFEGLFVQFLNGDRVEVVAAESGRLIRDPKTGRRMLALDNGVHVGHQVSGALLPMRRIDFGRNEIELPLGDVPEPGDRLRRMNLTELFNSKSAPMRAALHERLVPAWIVLLLAPLVLPVTLSGRRGRRFGIAVVAMAAYLLYSNTANVLLAQVTRGLDLLALFGLHGLAALLAVAITWGWWRRW